MNILFHGKGGIVGNSSSILFELLAFCIHASYDAVDADAAIQIVVVRGISITFTLKKKQLSFKTDIVVSKVNFNNSSIEKRGFRCFPDQCEKNPKHIQL